MVATIERFHCSYDSQPDCGVLILRVTTFTSSFVRSYPHNFTEGVFTYATPYQLPQVNPSVMLAQREKWLKWHSAWSQNNLSPTDKDKCSDWLLGVGLMTSSTTPTSDPASVCTEEEFQGQKVKKYRTSVAESAELRPEAETMETS